ncbi:MAG: GNAT family N-acetyltransferase [Chloroflexota bacterium]
MTQDIQIIQMTEADLQSVYELVQNTIQVSYYKVYPVEAIEFFKNHHRKENILNDSIAGYTAIAESNGQILGTGTLLGTNVRRVFVNPTHQHKGIGKLIVYELERKAELEGLFTLDLSSSLVSRQFWESVGFVLSKEDFLPVRNGKKLLFYEMVKTMRGSH